MLLSLFKRKSEARHVAAVTGGGAATGTEALLRRLEWTVIRRLDGQLQGDHRTLMRGAGLDLEYGAQDNTVSGCRFFDISGTAVQIGDVLKDDHHPDDPRTIVKKQLGGELLHS